MGILAIVGGVIAIALALLADTIGIGAKEGTMGWKQVALLVVGAALVIGGLFSAMRGPREPERPADGPPTGTP